MSIEQRMAQMEERLARLEGRVAYLESKNMTYGPLPTIPPTNPWPHPSAPYWGPPYTVACKMPDGTTKTIDLNSPIVAHTNE